MSKRTEPVLTIEDETLSAITGAISAAVERELGDQLSPEQLAKATSDMTNSVLQSLLDAGVTELRTENGELVAHDADGKAQESNKRATLLNVK